MNRNLFRRLNSKGSIAAIVVVGMVVFVGILAIVIDLGHIFMVKGELQNASDDCALRGARAFYADTAPISEPADKMRAQAQALAVIGDNVADKTQLQNLSDIHVGVWDFANRRWYYGEDVFTWPILKEDSGKPLGPGISVATRKSGALNEGPVALTLARIFGTATVNVAAPTTAALPPAGHMEDSDWTKILSGTPPPLRISDLAAKTYAGTEQTFTLYPNNDQYGGWHAYDIRNPNVPTLENLIWGLNTKTGADYPIPTLTAGANGTTINLQNGVDSHLFQVPDPSKPNDPNLWTILSRWLQETGRTVIDPKAPTYAKTDLSKPDVWTTILPVTTSAQASGDVKVLGFCPVDIVWVNPPPDKTIQMKIGDPMVAPPGVEGGGGNFGLMSLDVKIVR